MPPKKGRKKKKPSTQPAGAGRPPKPAMSKKAANKAHKKVLAAARKAAANRAHEKVDAAVALDLLKNSKGRARSYAENVLFLTCVFSLVLEALEEMKAAFLSAMRADPEKKKLLECKIEQRLEAGGHCVLWTPPYCPKLQPIEVFWAQGKNNAMNNFAEGQTMRTAVTNLRAGWYGDGAGKAACSCAGLVKKAKGEATNLIGKVDGLSGTIDALVVAEGAKFITQAEAGAQDHLVDTTALLPVAEDGYTMDMPAGCEEDAQELHTAVV